MEEGFIMYPNIEMVMKVQVLLEKITSIETELQNLRKKSTESQIPGAFEKAATVLQSLEPYLRMIEKKDGNATKDSELKGGVLQAVKAGDHSQAISLLAQWLENICLLKQQEDGRIRAACPTDDKAVQTQYEIPTLRRPHDGRLITLTNEDVRGILYNCDTVLKGGFGLAYVSSTKVPELDLRVVIKMIVVDKEDEIKMLSASNEKIASRVMHFAIVPLIGYMDEFLEQDKRVFYFLSPYLEGGNLQTVIARDKLCSYIKDIQLEHPRRIEILFQIASALDYLHTPVPNYRGIVLHMDLTSTNIVLDSFMNARVIDFGLAREMYEGQTKLTESKCLGTPGYYPTSRYSKLTVHEDYYNFGVVIRELLTGEAPYIADGSGSSELRKFDESLIKKKIQRIIWKDSSGYDKDLVSLSTKCLKSKQEKLCAAQIVKALETMVEYKPDSARNVNDKTRHSN